MNGQGTDEPGVTEVRAMALRCLARRDYSEAELLRKIRHRGAPDKIAREVVDELAGEGLVDDRRFAEAFARQRVGRRYGPLKIRAELRSRGVDDALASAVLEAHAGDFEASALTWLRRHLRGEPDYDEKARLYRSGTQRGFTHEQVMRALDRLGSED